MVGQSCLFSILLQTLTKYFKQIVILSQEVSYETFWNITLHCRKYRALCFKKVQNCDHVFFTVSHFIAFTCKFVFGNVDNKSKNGF